MQINIPEISSQIYKEQTFGILEQKYSVLGPMWISHQTEWLNNVYQSFKDHDKFLILIYLIKKTLDFYSRNFIKLNYDEFYFNDTLEIEKFNIIEIANYLNIPKESARRKVLELEKNGVIKKINRKIIVDRSAFPFVKPINSIKRISRFLSLFSEMLVKEKILLHPLTSIQLQGVIEKNFSFVWKLYYEMQIPMMISYKKIFNDLEAFHIHGICIDNQHTHTQKLNINDVNRPDFIKSIYSNGNIVGLNAMSIADITGIPRATVVRKLRILLEKKFLLIDEKKHYKLTGQAKQLIPLQSEVLKKLANFSSNVFNLTLL